MIGVGFRKTSIGKPGPIKPFWVFFFAKSFCRTLKTLFKHIYRLRFSRNRLDGLELVHCNVQMPLEALNVFRSCGCRYRMIINLGENDRIDEILNRNGSDRTFGKMSLHLPCNSIHQTYFYMNQATML